MCDLVEVVEGGSVLVELLLTDAFSVPGQNLVLNLINGASDGGEELLPSHAQVLRDRHRERNPLQNLQ